MMLSVKTRVSALATAIFVGLAGIALPFPAFASSTYPAAMQKALSQLYPAYSFCVPQCTACHLTTEGGPGRHNVFGDNLFLKGHLFGTNPDSVKGVLMNYFADNPNIDSDNDSVSDLTELERGDSPSIALPRGVGGFCPDIAYGCGARIAPAPPPVDRIGLFSAGFVILGLAAFRRRFRRVRST